MKDHPHEGANIETVVTFNENPLLVDGGIFFSTIKAQEELLSDAKKMPTDVLVEMYAAIDRLITYGHEHDDSDLIPDEHIQLHERIDSKGQQRHVRTMGLRLALGLTAVGYESFQRSLGPTLFLIIAWVSMLVIDTARAVHGFDKDKRQIYKDRLGRLEKFNERIRTELQKRLHKQPSVRR